jgi:hypothetical protein
MNYYYNLPQDIITKIEDKVKEEELINKSLEQWKTKMMFVNLIFEIGCEWGARSYTEMIEEGLTYREMVEQFDYWDYNGKLSFKVSEYEYYTFNYF